MLVPKLTLCDTVKADVNRMAKEQKLPVYLMGVTSTPTYPTMDYMQTDAVMSQILSAANARLW